MERCNTEHANSELPYLRITWLKTNSCEVEEESFAQRLSLAEVDLKNTSAASGCPQAAGSAGGRAFIRASVSPFVTPQLCVTSPLAVRAAEREECGGLCVVVY